jgi:hypothetical protein
MLTLETRQVDIPPVNVGKDVLGTRFSVDNLEVLTHPVHEMVLKCSLDHLMEKVRRQEFMDVGAWKVCREWLENNDQKGGRAPSDV